MNLTKLRSKSKVKNLSICFLLVACCLANLQAQDTTGRNNRVYEVSVQSILQLPLEKNQEKDIFSASKSSEKLFNAPLNAYVITQADMQNAGMTNIAEAMRLVPGMIVRESTNGNFTVDMRGGENALPYTDLGSLRGRGILLLVDGRPLYSQINGGIFWATVPIDIHDIKQIEVVQGPVAALYGSNAMSGVINIITFRAGRKKVRANLQTGNYQSVIGNIATTHQSADEKFGLTISGNFNQRNRTTDRYFYIPTMDEQPREAIVDSTSRSFNALERFPNPNLALNRYGINAFLEYVPNNDFNIRLSVGHEKSSTQSLGSGNTVTPIFNAFSETYYGHLDLQWQKLRVQGSLLTGNKDFKVGILPYELQVWDSSLEYDFTFFKRLKVTPLLAFRSFAYRDVNNQSSFFGLVSSESFKGIWNIAAGAKLDYALGEKLRFIGNIRLERFKESDLNYNSYQMIATYQPVTNHLIRAVVGKSNIAPNVFTTLLDLNFVSNISVAPGFTQFQTQVKGSAGQNTQLTNQNIYEVGYRGKLNSALSLDLSLYYSITQDYVLAIQQPFDFSQPPVASSETRYQNVDARLIQQGLTIGVTYQNKNLSFNPFISIQKSDLKDFSPYPDSPQVNPLQNTETTFDIEHRATPQFYGGFVANYRFTNRFNLNINGYFFEQHVFFADLQDEAEKFQTEADTGVQVSAQFLLNAKLSYALSKNMTVFGNARNIFANNYQSYLTDTIRPVWWLGLQYTL